MKGGVQVTEKRDTESVTASVYGAERTVLRKAGDCNG
jgi:hypothetical protein